MDPVDVLWISRHDDILARGYADEGLLEAVFDRTLWTPPRAHAFRHHEVRTDEWPDVPGAIVILPARHHASDDDVAWFRKRVDGLPWSIVILAGDEEWGFPWREIPETETRRVWIMQPLAAHEGLGLLPGGWSPGTKEGIGAYRDEYDAKPLDWFFAGQVTHERRRDCVSALKRVPNGELIATEGYMQGIERDEYRRKVASAKILPCPSGPYTVDTNRPLEAMEAGAIPVCDMRSPRGPKFDYWTLLFGDHPLPTVNQWSELRRVMPSLLSEWPGKANRIFAWWQGWKRDLVLRFEHQLCLLAGTPEVEDANDLITAVVTTSPLGSHPDTAIIEETVRSIRDQLPRAEIVIACDGVRPEQDDLRDQYDAYLRRLLWLTNHEWHNVVSVLLDSWGHQANATRRAMELVGTPLVLFVEHDTPLEGEIDWTGLCSVIESGEAEAVRFHIYDEIHPEHEYLMLDHSTRVVKSEHDDVPLRRTVQWWQRPHLASTRFYRDKVLPIFPESSRTMIEDKLYGVIENNYLDHGDAGWYDWRLYVYCPYGGFKRSGNLDGRAGAEKYAMRFE